MTALIIIYLLGWIGFGSMALLALTEEPHPQPRKQAIAVMGMAALWPLFLVVLVWMLVMG